MGLKDAVLYLLAMIPMWDTNFLFSFFFFGFISMLLSSRSGFSVTNI